MNLDRVKVEKFIKGNTTPVNMTLIKKTEFQTGRKAALISLIVLVVVSLLSYYGDNYFDSTLLVVLVNVVALIFVLCIGMVSIALCNKAIRNVHLSKVQTTESSAKIFVISATAGIVGMTFARTFLSNMSSHSALIVILGGAAFVFAIFAFIACKSFYIVFLIKRFEIT